VRYHCCEERRLAAVKAAGVLNGVEYVEVSDREAPTPALRQRTLYVRLLLPAAGLTTANVEISGGDRITSVGAEWVAPATSLPAGEDPSLVAGITDPATMMLVRTDSTGDHSFYTFRLVAPGSGTPPTGFDPLLAEVEFSFKVECDADFDCAPGHRCPVHEATSPPIDYTAKDYRSFRRLILDRMSLLAPGWTERTPADLGITLVEILAYLGDELSYRQDAAATEAYLETARRRTSLRRHARLVDHQVHDGANARVWATIQPSGDGAVVAASTALLTRVPGLPATMEPGDRDHREALAAGAETFETVEATTLYTSHAAFDFWTWGDVGCCLPVGATSATLVGHHPALKAGDVLILAEVAGAETGHAEDADPSHRTAVRLTHVVDATDPSGGLFADPPTGDAVDVTSIEWDEVDALTFPLCVGVEDLPGIAVARAFGNVVLADHGRTIAGEDLGVVPSPVLATVAAASEHCVDDVVEPVPVRYRPMLATTPLTHVTATPTTALAEGPTTAAVDTELAAATFGPALQTWLGARGVSFTAGAPVVRGGDDVWSVSDGTTVVSLLRDGGTLSIVGRRAPAASIRTSDARATTPAIELLGTTPSGTDTWRPRSDLLASAADSREFVVEVEHDESATLRFGDGVHGRRPEAGTGFVATYRVGNGTAGNIGPTALAHLVTTATDLVSVSNWLGATGGVEPEPADAIRRDAPEAYLVQQRAVTEADYAEVTERRTDVQRAAATFRWTGSWHTVFVTADRTGGGAVDDAFETTVRAHLEPFRMAGYDLEVDAPRFVALEVGLQVCVEPDHFRSHVEAAILDRLSSGIRRDGTIGLFHPDRFTFAQPVYLSAIVAEVQNIPGVQSVVADTFQRLRDDSTDAVGSGVLEMSRLEIARLDADPNFPERGVLTLDLGGGK
jgi:hypothetical protein